jgi:glycosyltransferase involved in cell wall biosynthesis
MKVYVLKANENWFCDRYHSEWCEYAKKYNCNNINDSDIIWLLPSWQWANIPLELLKTKKVVATVHHIVPNKFNLHEFKARDQFVDCYHVPCSQTKENIKKHTNKPIKIAGYWLNAEVWQPLDKEECRKDLNLDLNEYIIGSFQRDTEGSDLKTPKLEKGPDRFIEYAKKINKDNLRILLGGWRRQYIINRLEEENIKYTYIELAPREILKKMYASCDLYVVSSRHEGGPQSLLEASAMEVPIVSTKMGMAPDVLNKNCLIDIEDKVYFPTNKDVEECKLGAYKFEIKKHIKNYIDIFNLTDKM